MTTLMIPSFERRLLETVREEVAVRPIHEWPPHSLRLCLGLVAGVSENVAKGRGLLEARLADGVEALSFARDYGPFLSDLDEQLVGVRELLDRLSVTDATSERFAAALRSLEQETRVFRDLLAEALSRASEAPRPVDWGRVRAAEEAHGRGETEAF